MKSWLWLAVILAVGSLSAMQAAAESEPEAVVSPDPKTVVAEPYDENFSVGVCLGKGAGLAGIYTYFRPTDLLAFEADLGTRMFLYQSSDGELMDVYWPMMAAVKAQFYFLNRQKRVQPGVEMGVMYAEDAGSGAEMSGIMTFRLNRHLHLDAELGFGFFPDMDNKQLDYIVSQRGGSRNSYKLTSTGGFALMWGVGMSVVF